MLVLQVLKCPAEHIVCDDTVDHYVMHLIRRIKQEQLFAEKRAHWMEFKFPYD